MSVVIAKSYIEYKNETYWVEGTRISLDSIVYTFQQGLSPETSIVYTFQQGLSPETIVQSFPLLTLEQVYGAITYNEATQGRSR